jgi:Acetyltransferase (GNAT) domain
VKASLRRFVAGATTWFRAARSSLDYHYSRRSHILMETSDGREGFAMFGGFRARHRFGALYFATSEDTRTRLVIHQPVTADYCRHLVQRLGLVVFCGDSAPHDLASELLSIPLSVDMELPIPTVLEGAGAPWNRSAKANIAKVKRGGFGFDVVNGDGWVTEFHRRMFRPSMRSRHGAEAYVDSRRALARLARAAGSELLRVFQDGRWVAGTIGQSTPGGYRLLKLGWLNGDEGLLKSGVVSALYWFHIQRAAALGHCRILLGSVAPHLEDGVLLYKSHWGARLSVNPRDFGEFRLLLEPSHPACLRFLQAHSTVTMGTDRHLIVFSGRTPDAVDISPRVLSHVKRWYTWRDQPLAVPEVTTEEVPSPLRRWVTFRGSPGSG